MSATKKSGQPGLQIQGSDERYGTEVSSTSPALLAKMNETRNHLRLHSTMHLAVHFLLINPLIWTEDVMREASVYQHGCILSCARWKKRTSMGAILCSGDSVRLPAESAASA